MRPFTYKGRAYQRIESVTSAMPQGIYNLLVMQRGGTYAWDSMQNPGLKISDLDETAILGAVRGGIRGGRCRKVLCRRMSEPSLKNLTC